MFLPEISIVVLIHRVPWPACMISRGRIWKCSCSWWLVAKLEPAPL